MISEEDAIKYQTKCPKCGKVLKGECPACVEDGTLVHCDEVMKVKWEKIK